MPRRAPPLVGVAVATVATVAFAACHPLDVQLFDEVELESEADADAVVIDPPTRLPPDDAGTAPGPPACDPLSEACAACVAELACDAPQVCHPVSGLCTATCSPTAPECADDAICDESRGLCLECLDGGDCAEDDRPLCEPNTGVCVECRIDADCTGDPERSLTCLTTSGRCGCDEDADCESGLCNLDDQRCEEPAEPDEEEDDDL